MVYCGKPSKGCGLCRGRRIKCDQLQPECSQCTRVGSPCPGYRNETDLVFRDLSENVRMKCKRVKPKKGYPSRAVSKNSQIDAGTILDQRLIAEPYAFSNDGAALFFFHDYVLLESRHPSNLFDMLPSIYQASSPGSPLAEIITALGLVCLSKTKSRPQALIPARARYVAALHSVNSSIRDPGVATADETLLAVLLLGLYEDNTATNVSLEQWSNHINGALALLDARGAKQLERRVGRQLVTNLRTSIIANCLLKHARVPACIMRWSALLSQYESPEEASATSLFQIATSFCELQALIKMVEISTSIVPMALLIDESLEKWASVESRERSLKSSSASPLSVLSFEGSYTIYHSLSTATHWNHYRSIRIMLHEIILFQLSSQSLQLISSYFDSTSPHITQIERSKLLIITLGQDICASVRWCLNLTTEDCSSHQPKKAACAKLLLWPLYTARKSACVPEATARWISDTFDFIAMVTGVRKGVSLAKALRAWPCWADATQTLKAPFRDAVFSTDDVDYREGIDLTSG